MKRVTVTGIGGFFFRANDPSALNQWYQKNLGIDLVPAGYDQKPWSQKPGPTAFAAFPKDTDYFGNKTRVWMINFRVGNLDAMVAQLRSDWASMSPLILKSIPMAGLPDCMTRKGIPSSCGNQKENG